MIKWFKSRGFTDRLYFANFVSVHCIVFLVVFLTALSGKLNIMDMSALASIPPCAYAELGIHSAFIIWKSKAENISKYGNNENITM